ncbi:hypothetical protein NBRC116601_34900 [Cognatishimia sp. WU-CL00825]|uniref:hypothetical protein n=1 Tax=Cognatishimia sp. WU-CL00825 TaxID=3127658 RepID=UPI0031037D52
MSIEAIKTAMKSLIAAGTTMDLEALGKIYHDDLRIVMIDAQGHVNHADKVGFMTQFQALKDQGVPPLNTWAQYNDIWAEGNKGHVLVTRKNDLMGFDALLVLSIDFVFEDNRWQVAREVIYVRPDTGDYTGEEN